MSTTLAAPAAQADAAPPKSRVRTLGIAVLLLAVAAGAGWWFFLKPAGDTEPKPGETVTLEAIQVNLAGGHYLRLGIALELVEGAHEVDGSKALDSAIAVFSGLPVGEVNKPAVRETLREQLVERLHDRYHGDVLGVYFTEFVTQ